MTDVDRRQRPSTRSCAQLLARGDYHAPGFISVFLGTGAVQIQASHPEVDLPDTDLVNLNFRDILFGCADRSCWRAAQTRTLSMCGKNVVVLDDHSEQSKNTHRSLEAAISMQIASDSAELFRHLNADKATLYRCIMDVFAAAKRQYRLQLRPDEVLAEARWPNGSPRIEEINGALAQLAEWGNLESHPDTARVSSLSDFYRARFLYRLSQGGEAVESALAVFVQTLQRRAELQTVALEDIASQLLALEALAAEPEPDVAKIHETLRDLVRVFEGLAENAQAFMAGVARSIELQQAEASAVANYKKRLIDYLERFMGDLVRRSDTIARLILALEPRVDALLGQVAERESRDAAPGSAQDQANAQGLYLQGWRERWKGLRGWFLSTGHELPQAELLRARARSAIPQLLVAIAALNERRSGRSDRSADFRMLAGWFAACTNDGEANRLARAAFALNPARHFSLNADADDALPASTSWADAEPLKIHPRLREYGEAAPRGPLPRVRDRAEDRAFLALQIAEESLQVEAARKRLATGQTARLSDLGELDNPSFGLFLGLLGEALSEQAGPEMAVERQTGDGLLHIHLKPLAADSYARIDTPRGVFAGRDHIITITPLRGAL
ncbi:TIGR02677 family protein [Mesorhizobium sp. M1A.F.Ca.ET.072.01.1.1]|uniref:TIGR02677 family protein n=1 Tax=Mesorhizobium sp. M1A.F.Ca.ET.072.01.1.1 TaxID=2496753 RepID=UPI001FE1C7E0|nr:TIGR02677 family protein [Mesorhizobium sp. M1A.F.Ca.ET.072.01.1.1]